MRVAVHQPNYLPWTGFFHKMANCDIFVLLDNVQYTRRSFCNRTQVKSNQGAYWLSLPVVKRPFNQKISETLLFEPEKNLPRHLENLHHFYAKAPFYDLFKSKIRPVYQQPWRSLLLFNAALIRVLAEILGITTSLTFASMLGEAPQDKIERIIFLCQQLGADTYYSGRGGEAYNDAKAFNAANVNLEYQTFTPPIYPQCLGAFVPNLSVLDLIMHRGAKGGLLPP